MKKNIGNIGFSSSSVVFYIWSYLIFLTRREFIQSFTDSDIILPEYKFQSPGSVILWFKSLPILFILWFLHL